MQSMMKYFLGGLMLLICSVSNAQLGEWTWVHGNSAPNQPANFGTLGVSSPTNKPAAMYEGCEWTDLNGNFWLYGGQITAGNFYGDLWKYDPAINEWVWVKGPGFINPAPVYGIQGVPSPANNPGGRGWAPSSWVDNNNNLWMFAGCDENTTDMNNLWMYNISTNEWTWMHGANFPNSSGNPGVMGVPDPANEPAARHESTCSWVDGNGDLWTFGGYGSNQTDDLWRYNIATNTWTWMKGDPINPDPPVYGTMGVPDPSNTPGARNSYSRWADKNGNLWLFGGVFYAAGTYSDIWKYSIATNEWTWMKGPNFTDDTGVYGTQCIEDSLNSPPSHNENRSCWMDSCGNFWAFGGVLATGTYPAKNDLWKYNPTTNNWTWMSGSAGINDPGNYGTIGVSAPTNVPPARMGSYAWQDNNGNIWMGFGQTPNTNGYRNDLWRYVPDPACGGCSLVPLALFTAPNHICPGTCTGFTNLSQFATSYLWSFQGATPSTSVDVNPTNICYNTPGNYSVSLIATSSVTSDTLTLNNYITVYPYPSPQGITQSGDTLFAYVGAISYQWYYNGNIVNGATNSFYVAPISGNYNVVATDPNGCEVEAAIFDVIAKIFEQEEIGDFAIFPNPAENKLSIQNLNPENKILAVNSIAFYNTVGERVMVVPVSFTDNLPSVVDISALANGMYWLEISSGQKIFRARIIKSGNQ